MLLIINNKIRKKNFLLGILREVQTASKKKIYINLNLYWFFKIFIIISLLYINFLKSIRKLIWLFLFFIELEIQDDLGMPVNYVRIKALEDSIRKDIISDKNSLHRAITPVLMLAHFFALLPVQGIKGQNTSYLVWVLWNFVF